MPDSRESEPTADAHDSIVNEAGKCQRGRHLFAQQKNNGYLHPRRSIRRGQRGGAVLAGGLAALVVALGSSACATTGGAGLASHPADRVSTGPSDADAGSASASPLETVVQDPSSPDTSLVRAKSTLPVAMSTGTAIVQGWLSALYAFDEASRTSDWRSPYLTATEVNPELDVVVSELRALARARIVTTGNTQLMRVSVVSVSGSTAQLVGCVNRGEIEVFSSTRRPVPGAAGRAAREVISAEMAATFAGWKVKSETNKEAQCPFG